MSRQLQPEHFSVIIDAPNTIHMYCHTERLAYKHSSIKCGDKMYVHLQKKKNHYRNSINAHTQRQKKSWITLRKKSVSLEPDF